MRDAAPWLRTASMYQTYDDRGGPAMTRAALPRLRDELQRRGLDGFIVPHEDEWQNEYVPPAHDRLLWVTGFTGSAGAAVVMRDRAAIFVDGRYTLQVRHQVDLSLIEPRSLVDEGVHGWLRAHGRAGERVGYDPRLVAPESLGRWRDAAAEAGVTLVATTENPVDAVWHERPPSPSAIVKPHPEAFSGESALAKRGRLAADMAKDGIDAAVLTFPASLAWLFNIRGGDVSYTPLPLGAAVLNADASADLFLDPAKVTPDLVSWLGNQVRLRHPDEIGPAIDAMAGKTVLMDPALASAWHHERAEAAGATVIRKADPVALPRARKNAVEVEGSRRAHRRDGGAVARFLHWFAETAPLGGLTEISAAEKLEAFRVETGDLVDLSFDSISGAGPNGAVVHYRVSKSTVLPIENGQLFLIDSGGQYRDGTTDITRTIAVGKPTAEMKDRFTRVLKGHIALSRVRFPAGVYGTQLDALARLSLWEVGLDYEHGTGHGVGSYLGVHEGPHRIARTLTGVPLEPGMIVSNEPGYYKTGAYGIRVENLQVVTEASIPEGGEKPMMGFETLTRAPIDRSLIDTSMLTAAERDWLNAYHRQVLADVGPLVPPDTFAWLQGACAPV
jgi:Xaa-Pro aminopeptidase